MRKIRLTRKFIANYLALEINGSIFYMLSKEMLGINEIDLFDKEADYFEKEDYQEIVSLIQQVKQLTEKRSSELKQEVDNKLKNNENLFIYIPGGKNIRPFYGKKNGLDF